MALGAFLDALGKKECDDAFACQATWPTAEGPFNDYWGATINECYMGSAEYYDLTKIQAAVSGGKLTYDGVAAQMCVSAFAAPVCATYWTTGGLPEVCWDALSGNTADGAACTTDFECAGENSYCDETSLKCTADTGA
jgi:hypothetical protein